MIFDTLNLCISILRSQFFQRPHKAYNGVYVENAPEDVYRELVDSHHFENAHKFSYQHPDELYNIRRSEGLADGDTHMELHIRIFAAGDGGAFLQSHYEKDRFTHTEAHLKGDGLSWSEGLRRTLEIVDGEEGDPPWVNND